MCCVFYVSPPISPFALFQLEPNKRTSRSTELVHGEMRLIITTLTSLCVLLAPTHPV